MVPNNDKDHKQKRSITILRLSNLKSKKAIMEIFKENGRLYSCSENH